MPDTVYLLINGKKLDRFISYEVDADMYSGAAVFKIEMARPDIPVKAGTGCELWVNDQLELTGIIDKTVASYDKAGSKLSITGRDLMGWLVDAHAEEFITLKDYTAKRLVERLLRKAPKEFFKLTTVQYAENVKGRLKSKAAKVGIFDTTTALSQIEPGMSVFEVLSQFTKSRGFLFYALPNGTFVLGRAKEAGSIPAFTLTHRKDGQGNNIITGEIDEDISKQYSQVFVIGQKQGQVFSGPGGTTTTTPAQNNVEALLKAPDGFPFYKPFMLKDEYGGDQPELQGRMALDKMRHDGYKYSCTVKGHSQNGKNWSINELAHVRDEDKDINLNRALLITGRTFVKAKDDKGAYTKLRLGLPGMIAV